MNYPKEPQNQETVRTPEQVIGAMSATMQEALDACNITPIQFDDGNSERTVATKFRRSIDPISVQLVEKVNANGSTKSYEFNQITYHDRNTIRGYRWTESGSELERTWRPVGGSPDESTVAETVDPLSLDDNNENIDRRIRAVPKEYQAQQEYDKFHDISETTDDFEQQPTPARKGSLGKLAGKLASARARRS